MENNEKRSSRQVSRRKLLKSAGLLAGAAALGSNVLWTPEAEAAPSWCLPGATVAMDFENNRYFGASLNDLKIDNATGGYAEDSAGLLHQFGPNTLRRTTLGLLVESAQSNLALWSRELANPIWVKTNLKVQNAPVGADGKAGAGCRLTATANNATIVQPIPNATKTMYGGKNKDGVVGIGGCHSVCYIKRVKGSGPVYISESPSFNAFVDVSGWLNPNGYTQINLRYNAIPTSKMGIKLGTAGDCVDVDMMQFTIEASRNCIASSSVYPVTDKILWRQADMVTVNPESKLYKVLAGTEGTVYVKTLNLLGQSSAFYRFGTKACIRRFGGRHGGAPQGALNPEFDEAGFRPIETFLGSNGDRRLANYAWETVGNDNVENPQSILKTGALVRTVLTWGNGKASVVANNGPVGTGPCSRTNAHGTLYLGFTFDGSGFITNTRQRNTFMCDGYIQNITFIPHVLKDYGVSLTAGSQARPVGAPPPKVSSLICWTDMWTHRTFVGSTKVAFECTLSGAKIYYTLDGSEPDSSKILYTKPFKLTATTTVKARAFKSGCKPSDLFDVVFTKKAAK